MSHHPIHREGGGADGRAEARMPRGDLALLVVVTAVAIVAFLPPTRGAELAGISLVAWLMLLLMMAAPAAGLVLALRGGKD